VAAERRRCQPEHLPLGVDQVVLAFAVVVELSPGAHVREVAVELEIDLERHPGDIELAPATAHEQAMVAARLRELAPHDSCCATS